MEENYEEEKKNFLKWLISTFACPQKCSLMLVLWNYYSWHAMSKSSLLHELAKIEKGKKNLGRWQWGEKRQCGGRERDERRTKNVGEELWGKKWKSGGVEVKWKENELIG
jgi:hypothetical protein